MGFINEILQILQDEITVVISASGLFKKKIGCRWLVS